MGAGYAVIYDEESGNSEFSEDYVLGISVFYVLSNGSEVGDTLSLRCHNRRKRQRLPFR